jgi:acetyl-CoA synthetase
MPFYEKYLEKPIDVHGSFAELCRDFKVNVPDGFNFAYDVADVLAEEQPQATAMLWYSDTMEKRTFTFADMKRLSDQSAVYLRSLGIVKGDKVMLVLKSHHAFWPTILALHKIGAVAVPATHMLTQKDYIYRFNTAGIKMVVAAGEQAIMDHIDAALAECPSVEIRAFSRSTYAAEKGNNGWLDYDAGCVASMPHLPGGESPKDRGDYPSGTDPLFMFFSSGTTGYPKMVLQNHNYPLGHIATALLWHRCIPGGLHYTMADTGWAKSFWGKMYGQWLCESAVLTHDYEKFKAADQLALLAEAKVTTFCTPPTILRFMIREDLKAYDLSSLRHCTTAGEALNPEVFTRWLEGTGRPLCEGFGQTETTLLCGTPYPWVEPRIGSMGRPMPGWDVVIVDGEDQEVAPGVTGEVCIRVPTGRRPVGLFDGYYRDPAKTAEAEHDGFYHTGDTAYRDEDGYFWYVGRTDDLIKSSGYRIGPFEVESALMEHPAVVECAVTGVPDQERGFAVKATIVLAAGYAPSPELTKELQDHVKKVTAPYKYPRVVQYAASLPKTVNGKIRRAEIREGDK